MNCIVCHSSVKQSGKCSSGCNITYFYNEKPEIIYLVHYVQYPYMITVDIMDRTTALRVNLNDNDIFMESEQIIELNKLVWIFPETVSYWVDRLKRLAIIS